MDSMGNLLIFFMISLFLYLLISFLKLLYVYCWKPLSLQHVMNSQGIKGPPYQFIQGSNNEARKLSMEALSKSLPLTNYILQTVMPQVSYWTKIYGNNYLSWVGVRPQFVITEPEMVKEVLKDSEKCFPKAHLEGAAKKLLGDGIVTTEGEKWLRQRKLANYVFHGESLKNMIPSVIASIEIMLDKWKGQEGKEIEIFQEFKLMTSEVISRTAFGSSYLEGKKIFDMLTKLGIIVNRNMFKSRIPGVKFEFSSMHCQMARIHSEYDKIWKSGDEIESEKLDKGIYDSVMEMVKKREEKVVNGEADNFGCDFLGLLIKAFHNSEEENRFSEQDLVDECKTFYIAGQETTTSLLSWAMLMLSIHRDWQEKAREEVIELFGNQNPTSEGLSRLKIMNMIIYETLRLYAPVNGLARTTARELRLGKLVLPAGLDIIIPNLALHHSPQIWGEDALVFKPERFAEGIAKATKYNAAAFIPFGMGPRSCAGMSFAITEAKAALSMILQRYNIDLSPAYVHSPVSVLTLLPQHGIQVILQSSIVILKVNVGKDIMFNN